MARLTDVVEDGRAPEFARIVDNEVAEAQEPLGNTGRHRDVLDLAKRNVSRGSRDEARINLYLRIR